MFDTRTDAIELLEEAKFQFGTYDSQSSAVHVRKNLVLTLVMNNGPAILTFDKNACRRIKSDFRQRHMAEKTKNNIKKLEVKREYRRGAPDKIVQ